MKKLIFLIIFIGLFLFSASSVTAQNVAGTSAEISFGYKISEKDKQEIDAYKTKIAIETVLKKYDSPMASEVDSFYNACKKYNLDCYLLPAIAGVESTFGRAIYQGSYNPFGWGRGLTKFTSWGDGIDSVGRGIREDYINKWKAESVEDIGKIYCEGNTWSSRVNSFISQFKAEEDKVSLFLKTNPVQL